MQRVMPLSLYTDIEVPELAGVHPHLPGVAALLLRPESGPALPRA
jgi:hypothetical protein